MKYMQSTGAALGAALLVAACGGGFSDPAGSQNANPGRGDLVQTPPVRVISMSAADLTDPISRLGCCWSKPAATGHRLRFRPSALRR